MVSKIICGATWGLPHCYCSVRYLPPQLKNYIILTCLKYQQNKPGWHVTTKENILGERREIRYKMFFIRKM